MSVSPALRRARLLGQMSQARQSEQPALGGPASCGLDLREALSFTHLRETPPGPSSC